MTIFRSKHLLLILFLTANVFFIGCENPDEKPSNGQLSDKSVTNTPSSSSQEMENKEDDTTPDPIIYSPEDSVWLNQLNKVQTKFPDWKCHWFCPLTNEQTFYYITTDDFEMLNDSIVSQNHKMGLLNENFETVVPVKFYKIYNPNATVPGHIVLETENGKRGLFNIKTSTIIEPKYAKILPSLNVGKSKDIIAYLQLESSNPDAYEVLKSDGSIETQVGYDESVSDWKFNMADTTLAWLRPAKNFTNQNYKYLIPEPNAMFSPSYLYDWGVLPEYCENLGQDVEGIIGIDHLEVALAKKSSFFGRIKVFISNFYKSGVSGRGYSIEKNQLHVVTDNNSSVNSIRLPDNYGPIEFLSCENDATHTWPDPLRFISVDTVEYMNIKSKYKAYTYFQNYQYYVVRSDGNIDQLTSNRTFDFTKFIKIDESYFIGQFIGYDRSKEDFPKHFFQDHYTIEDLDVMRNEIYADYGYQFSTSKWLNYFKEQNWYKPDADNVDAFLTPIDQHNIKVILKAKKRLQKNEKKIINKRYVRCDTVG